MKPLPPESSSSINTGLPEHSCRPLMAGYSTSVIRTRNKTKTTRIHAQTNSQVTAEEYEPFPTKEAALAYERQTFGINLDPPRFDTFVAAPPNNPWIPIKIRVKVLGSKTFSVELSQGMLVQDLKEHIWRTWKMDPSMQRIVLGGRDLDDKFAIDYLCVKDNDQLWLIPRLRGGGGNEHKRAVAIVLKSWDGVLEGLRQQSKINAGEQLYFSRIIDENWLEGRTDKSTSLIIFPRSFVALTKVDTRMEAVLRSIDCDFKVWDKADVLAAISADSSLSAVFPPPPPSQNPALDEFFRATRIRIMLYRRVQDNTVGVSLAFISSPDSRVSSATLRLTYQDGTILDIEPGNLIEGPSTTATHSVKASRTFSLTLGPTSAPQATAGNESHQSSTVEYTRRTANYIVGDGTGSTVAYWVMKEDTGEAGRHGLPSHSEMSVRLNLLPVTFEYEAKATLVLGDGATASWWNTRSFSSGKRSAVFNDVASAIV